MTCKHIKEVERELLCRRSFVVRAFAMFFCSYWPPAVVCDCDVVCPSLDVECNSFSGHSKLSVKMMFTASLTLPGQRSCVHVCVQAGVSAVGLCIDTCIRGTLLVSNTCGPSMCVLVCGYFTGCIGDQQG